VSLKHRISSKELNERMGVECVGDGLITSSIKEKMDGCLLVEMFFVCFFGARGRGSGKKVCK